MKIDKVTLAFLNKIVLRDIDLEIKKWEFVFLIGYSGSWKTSLIRSIIGDFKPYKWDIILDNGMSVYKNQSERILDEYRRNIWIIFQDYKLMESKKVYENVAFAMEVCGYKDDEIRKKVPEVLNRVGLLVKKDKFVQELSGWEKQRVSIARALVREPDLIIWDEPTGNLDPETAKWIMDIFEELSKAWKTIIIASHDKSIVDRMKKRVVSFKDKEVFSDENPGKYNLD